MISYEINRFREPCPTSMPSAFIRSHQWNVPACWTIAADDNTEPVAALLGCSHNRHDEDGVDVLLLVLLLPLR